MNKKLPPRLHQVMISMSMGKTRKQIAYETGLSIHTVKTTSFRLAARGTLMAMASMNNRWAMTQSQTTSARTTETIRG